MNKALSQFFTERGLTVTDNAASGTAEGYEVNAIIHMMDKVAPLRFHFSCFTTSDQRGDIEGALRTAAIPGMPLTEWTFYGLTIGLNAMTLKQLVKRLPGIFETIVQILKTNGALGVGYCPVCGAPLSEESKRYCVEEMYITFDCACAAQINAAIQSENSEFRAAPNNYLRGFCGALIGGLAGALVAYILFQVGFISAISVFAAIALGSFLYQKFGGKPNKVMIVIVSVTAFAFMIAAVFGVYLLEISAMLDEEGIAMSTFEAFGNLMQNAEFAGEFLSNLALTVLFSVVGAVCEVVVLARKIKRKTEIQ